MKLIKLNPRTPGTRHQINLTKNSLSKNNKVFKGLVFNISRAFGRSSQTGHITTWHKGGGCKKLYKNINFSNDENTSLVISIHYDSYRSSLLSFSFDIFKKKFYFFLNSQTNFPGTLTTCSFNKPEFFFGNRTQICNFPIGSLIFNLSLNSLSICKYSRSAGTYCQILQKKDDMAQIRLPSGKIVLHSIFAYANLGSVSNSKHNLTVLGKAGRKRLKGFRPIVRGVAMNPVDHPHGGRTNGGRPSVSPWGKLTKGKPTVF